MAASTWTTTVTPDNRIYHTTTITTTDGSEILELKPYMETTLLINYDTGGGAGANSLTVRLANVASPTSSDMVDAVTGINADYDDKINGAATAIEIDSSGTDTHKVTVMEILK